MLKEDDEEYKKRLERARVLRNYVGMTTENDLANNTASIQYDDEYQERLNRAKELRNSVGMITDSDLESNNLIYKPATSVIDIPEQNNYKSVDNILEDQNKTNYEDTNNIETETKTDIEPEKETTPEQDRWNVIVNGKKPSSIMTEEDKEKEKLEEEQAAKIASETNSDTNPFSQFGKMIENMWLGIVSNAKAATKYATEPQLPKQQEAEMLSNTNSIPGEAYKYENFEKPLLTNKTNNNTYDTSNLFPYKKENTTETKNDSNLAFNTLKDDFQAKAQEEIEQSKDAYGNIELNPMQRELSKSIVEDENKIASNTNQIENPIVKKVSELAPSFANSLFGAGLSMINPYLGTTYFIVSASGMYEAEGRSRGMSKDEARAYGTIMGFAEGATEEIEIGNILKAGKAFRKGLFKEAFKNIGIDMANNAVQEAIIDPIDEVASYVTSGKTKHDYSTRKGWEELGEDMVQDAIDGALSSLLMGGIDLQINSAVRVYNKITNGQNPTRTEIQEAYKDIQDNPNIDVNQAFKDSFEYQKEKVQNGGKQVYSVINMDNNGNITGIKQAVGYPIDYSNDQVHITPVVVYTDGYYNVIDAESGLRLDTTQYGNKEAAIENFNERMADPSNSLIEAINSEVTKAKLGLVEKMADVATKIQQNPEEVKKQNKILFVDEDKIFTPVEAKETLQKYGIDTEITNRAYLGQEINDIINNKLAETIQNENLGTLNNQTANNTNKDNTTLNKENKENKTPEQSKFYEDKPNYAVSNVEDIEKAFNKKKSYTRDEAYEIMQDVLEDTYDKTLDDDMFIDIEEKDGKLEAILYDGRENDYIYDTFPEVNRVEVVKNKDGKYTAKAINNAIKEVATIPNENSPIQGQVDIEGNIVEQNNNINKSDEEIRNIVKYNQDGREIKDSNYIDFMTERYKDNLNISKIITDTSYVSTLLDKTYQEAVKLVGTEKRNTLRNKQKDLMLKELFDKISDTSFTIEKTLKTQTGNLETKKLDILITQKGINESFNKSISDEKYAIVPYLDTIIKTSKDGIIRDESKIRSNIDEWYYLYNTANINGKLYSIKVDIKKTPQGDRFYVHRVNLIHKEGTSSQIPAVGNGTIKTNKAPSVTNSIPQNNQNVKNDKNTINNKSMQNEENNNTKKTKTDNTKSNSQKTNIQDFGEKIGGARKDLSTGRTTTKTGKEVIHDYTVNETDNGYSVNFKNKVLKEGFKTQAEAEQYILDFKNSIKDNMAFVYEGTNRDGETRYMIYLRNPRTLKSQSTGKIFTNKQDAESYAMALSMYLKDNGKNLFRPQIQKVERENTKNINATKATGEDILKNFGFKGGEFGNWVTQAERQQFLNYAQDAFTDLAAALNITPDSLGQQEAMSIAFGARGHGLTGAVAHFEPAKKVINMTRLKVAGSLAHEYGHSIDNYISRIGGYSQDGMATTNGRNPKLSDNMQKAVKEVTDAMRYNVSTNQEEIDKKNAIYEKARKENLEYNLRYLDKVFNGEAHNYRRIKGKYEEVPIKVTAKQKSDYQKIRNTLMEGGLKGDIDYKMTDTRSLKAEKIYPEPINTLQKMYKEVVGRKIDDDTVYSIFRNGKPTRQITEVKSESGYSKSALELDRETGRTAAYFSRIDEMWARAFESYISDKLKAKGIKDTYLVHSVNNNEYALFNPFPAGEERKNINKAFDNLIQTMKDEGYFTESEAPQNYDENTGIRYMKKNTSKTRTVQGLESYNIEDLKAAFKGDIEQILNDNDISDVDIVDIDLHGSRLRGTAKKDSDLDVVVQYNGDIREDDLFNILNENPLEIEGIKVDINPIQEDIKDYMERSNKYDQEVLTKNKSDSDIRYMKKNKASKQSLAKQFEEITGDSIIRAEAKLAGIELRNMQRQNGKLDGKLEENPYSNEAMAIYNKYNNNNKSSKYLYHSTATENLQSIIENGLTIGNKQNQEGISAKDKIYLSATEELAQSFAPNDSITLRINPNAKLENLSSDLLGGEGSYSITNNIPANMLQIKKNGKWVNLLDSQIDYTANKNLTKDILDKYNITHSENSVDDKRFSQFYNKYKSDYDDWNNSAVEYQKRNGALSTVYLNYDNNLVKLTTTKEGNKLYIDELYVEKQRQGTGTKIVEALKDYAKKANLKIETDRELLTAKEFWNKVLRKDSSVTDSEGRTLSKEQQEFFKDSKIRDAEGNLLVMYHGTEANVGIPEEYKFTIFDEDKQGSHGSWFGNGFYFTDDKNHAKDYAHSKGDVYEVYLNITNPYEPSYDINTSFYEEYLDKFDKILKEKFSEEAPLRPNTIKEVLKASGFDGIKIGNTVVAFNSNQIKNVTNTNPTLNKDIRFIKGSINDTLRNAERGESYIEQEIQKIEKTGDWDNSIPITKLSDIRKTIEDYLGLGIKKGHFRQDAYALYKTNNDVIRTKEFKDMDSILHETGHAIDLGKRLNIDKEAIADELFSAIDKLGGYEDESKTIRLEEGFAEVIREYSIIPEQAKKEYPQTVAILEGMKKTDQKFNNFITKVQKQAYNYIHQNPRNRDLSNQSIGEQTDKTPLTKNTIKQLVMQNIYDKDWIVKSAVNEMAKTQGKTTNQIKASENAYYLTRLASGKTDKVVSKLSDGYIDEKGNKLNPRLSGIGDILGNDSERWNDLRAYLVAQRDLEYKAKTLKTGLRTADSIAVVKQFKNDTSIQEASKLIYDTLNGVMQYAVNNGLVSQETAERLKQSNAFYVPMQRVLENRGNQVGRKGAVADIIKRRTGSELDIKDVLENIIVNTSNIIQQVENNNVLKALYKQGKESGVKGTIYDVIDTPMTKIGTQTLEIWEKELQKQGVNTKNLDLEKTIDIFAPNKKIDVQNLITSFIDDNGKRVYLQFDKDAKDLYYSIMNMDKKFMSNVLKINSKLNMPLRYGATMANLGFAIPNMISDTAQASIFSNAGFIPVVDNALGVLDIMATKSKSVRNFLNSVAPEYAKRINKLYALYQQSGATNSTRLSQYRESSQNLMSNVYGTKSKVLGIKEKYKPLKRLLDLLTYIPEISEQSTRFRVFEKNYDYYKKKGTAEMDARILAALESRDATQDFGRTGNLTREINQLIPFSAARVGSAYTFAEKMKANPKQVTMRLAILTAMAMAIKSMGYDDDEIEELNQRKKDDNFVFRVGDKIVTIKKPQGILRSIVNFAEYIQDLATDHIEEGKEGDRLSKWLNNAIMDNMPADEVTGFVPNAVAPIIENAINKDFYYNTDIVKSYDLDLPDSEQYYDYNSQLAIWLGKIFNYSPAKIDNLISGYFGGLGTTTTSTIDYTLGKAGVIPEKPEMGAEQDPIGKRFVVNVNTNSASIDEVYNRKTELTKKKNGGTITSEEEKELDNLKSAVSNMSDLNKQIKEIKKDLTMSGEEKAEKIKKLQEEKTDTARKALGKDLIHQENESNITSTQFYPSNTIKKNGYSLTLNSEQKKEYEQYAYEYYKKYEKQGLYNEEKMKEIQTQAKEYAKSQMFKRYRSSLVKTK